MKRSLLALSSLSLVVSVIAFAKTRYSGEFDYHDFRPSAVHFHRHTRAQIDHLCKTGDGASAEDMEEREHREFERSTEELNKQLAALTAKIKKDDNDYAKLNDEPVALPRFLKAQAAWVQYRDNYCYSYIYDPGPGSARYIFF
ncbi:DUF1311 domain-containing protein [Paraburkholderia sp. MMS20-SJTN17]|uniref:DUF1311 domain-containing protein n=1 Tax=Paraburkholderia translucens TaxID=2886945 RepID=A0ABS8KCE8_9BURK|nr:lysozyme inhibitor LprI family protein [Paraburkholderia sp. MMS20-SJTN17]MCC8402412.1 DUF1311 domain-containing protein [Paraburkholderia sp. MMS20-SJTN17]